MTLKEFSKKWVLAAPSVPTLKRREAAVAPLLEVFDGASLGGVDEAEARVFAARHPGSVRYAKSLYAQAVEDGHLDRSPFRNVKVRTQKRPLDVPARERLWTAVEAARGLDPDFRSILLVAAGTGLRVSELCKLELRDVKNGDDLRVLVRDGKGGVHRPALVLEPFGEHHCEWALRGSMKGEGGEERRVWTHPDGRPLTRHHVSSMWATVRAQVGLERCRFHDIRHFHATWLLDCGCTAEDVAIQLHGHPDPRTVIEVYGHPSHELARQRLRKLTGGSPDG